MDNTYRIRFYMWLKQHIAKTPEGEILPVWLQWVWRLLFPIKALYYRTARREGYQFQNDTWVIHGYTFSGKFFHHLAHGGNDAFKVVSRKNGTITFERH